MALTAATSTSSAAANSKPQLPFWNASSQEWSGKLWSFTKTACAAVDSNCWSSSFRMQRQTTPCSPTTPPLWRTLANGNPPLQPEDGKTRKVRKIRIYPSKQQDTKLKQWFGAARSWKTTACPMTKKALRALHLNKEALENTAEWALLTPYDLRHEALRDFLMALKATQARRNKKRKVEFAFRSRKANSQSLSVPKKHWGHLRGAYADVCLVAASCVAISHSQPRCNRTHAWCVHVWATTTFVCPSRWTFGARAKPLQR